MYSILKLSVFVLIIANSLPVFSQEKDELPMSIYSPKTQFAFFEKGANVRDNLLSMGYPFLMVDIEDIKSGLFTISYSNFGKSATNFVFESYHKIIFNETDKYYDPNKIAVFPICNRLN